ncbi:MAG: hypothetical protein ABI039_15040 [Vicinamibacterales bacterium]
MPAIGPLLVIVATTGLLYSSASIAFGGVLPGLIAAAAVMMAPLLWTQASALPSSLHPLLCVGLWLLAIAQLSSTRRVWWAGVAGAALGAGIYLSVASVVMMPCYVVLTLAVGLSSRALSRTAVMVFLGAFTVTALPLFVGWAMRPEQFREIVNSHHLYDANRYNFLQGTREVTSWVGLTARSEVFWDYLNPAFLFVTGRVLAWPLVVLLPVGLYYALVKDSTMPGRLALVGYVAAPLAASLTAEPPVAARILWIIPFAALLSACAVAHVRRQLAGRPSSSNAS